MAFSSSLSFLVEQRFVAAEMRFAHSSAMQYEQSGVRVGAMNSRTPTG
jgi:hypothetical protein